ncbi:SCO family protein [Macrococcus brunensis]|uniref:SCO family protein n=1 Tax=Macrococcus brunensis TaxID=198483 RepID=A0A4R6BBF0_9STAP|nr:SCO family protein [Macrococcus brunensis]TDL94297.1 SCO family protein [Macrococcus brunensis]
MKKFILLLLLSVLAGCGNLKIQEGYGNTLSEFKATDENGKIFNTKDMQGKVWLVDFIFTNCETVCPPMTKNMSDVTEELEKKGIKNYGVLSMSVDPKVDSPNKLKAYVKDLDQTGGKWKLVTGYKPKDIADFAVENFKTIVAAPTIGTNQATHGTSFYLIDQNRKIIKDYIGKDTGEEKFPKNEIVEDVQTLVDKGPIK